MTIKIIHNIVSASIFTLVAISLVIGSSYVASASSLSGRLPDIQVVLSLASLNTVSAGEPIIVQADVKNLTEDEKTGYSQPQGQDWLTETMTDSSGHAVPATPQFSTQQSAGGLQVDMHQFLVPALATYRDYDVINSKFKRLHLGRYTLTIHAHLLYSSLADAPGIRTSGEISQTVSFPIVVLQANPTKLAADAQSLTNTILQEQNLPSVSFETKIMHLDELFSMPGAIAGPYWKQIAAQHIDISDELYHVHNAIAADVLASLASNTAYPHEETATYLNRLDQMYRTSDIELQQQIRAICTDHGIASPETRPELVVTN